MSAAPLSTSAATDRIMLVESPNTIMQSPNAATALNSARPARLNGGIHAMTPLITTAPTAGAARRMPSPDGPT